MLNNKLNKQLLTDSFFSKCGYISNITNMFA